MTIEYIFFIQFHLFHLINLYFKHYFHYYPSILINALIKYILLIINMSLYINYLYGKTF